MREIGPAVGDRRASSDVCIGIEGTLRSGAPDQRRTILSGPNGLAHLSALRALVAPERVRASMASRLAE